VPFRICKTFEVENAHMLSLHPEKCKYPHGHSRRVEVIVSAKELDGANMVCDFKAIKLAIGEFIDSFDHAICINSKDPLLHSLQNVPGIRLIKYEDTDPTTEVMAKHMFDHIQMALRSTKLYPREDGRLVYKIGSNVKLERVRVWETSSSWAEYSE
jgi:6-pyruvoyltetrahydropterin/6-carboxytetrahydropterin synthase